MKRVYSVAATFWVFVTAATLVGCEGASLKWADGKFRVERPAVVRLSPDAIAVVGEIDKSTVALFREIAATGVQNVHLRSPGGDVVASIEIAREIHRRKMDVIVDRYCYSSCANYLFPAGRNKTVLESGALLMHGSATFRPQNVASQFPSTTDRMVAIERFLASLSLRPVEGDPFVSPTYERIRKMIGTASESHSDDARKLEEAFHVELGLNPILLDYSSVVGACRGTASAELKLEIPPKFGDEQQVSVNRSKAFSSSRQTWFRPTREDWEFIGVKGITEYQEPSRLAGVLADAKSLFPQTIVAGPISKLSETACR